MKHLFKGIYQLTIEKIEKEFSKPVQDKLFSKDDLFIDLSQIRFAQLSAINYLVLKVESEGKNDRLKTLYVALPTNDYTKSEKISADIAFNKIKANILQSRINANSFLKNTKFISALKLGVSFYKIDTFFTEKYNFESEVKTENFENAFEEIVDLSINKHFGYHYLYPMEWITVSEITINYESIEEKFKQVLENSNRGLDTIDVNAIKNVIFSELSKNVQEHTKSKTEEKRFLLSIGLIASKSLEINQDKLTIDYDFNNWVLKEQITSLVEIYFGDTGGGFFNKEFIEKCKIEGIVKKNEQLKWAFKKWTTKKFKEERRGTKGLYRINRIVNNYNGIFHIITNNQNGGYRKGGFKTENWVERKCDTDFDGTFISIKLCPYSTVKEFKFTLKENQNHRNWKTINLDVYKNEQQLITYIQEEFKSENYILSIIDLDKNKNNDEQAKMDLLNNLLLEISYNAHPSGAVVYINSNLEKSTLDTIINSINEFIINKTSTDLSEEKDNEDIYDTVIVIYGKHTFWYGGNQNIINILNEVYEKNFDKKIDELNSFIVLSPEEKVKVRQSLENDNKLIHINNIGEIELNFTNLNNHFSNIIKEKIISEKASQSEKLFSPKVQVLDYWVDIESILNDNEFGFGLTLYLKALEHINQNIKIDKQEQLYILIDHKQHIKLATSIITLLGLNKKNLINIQDEIQKNSLRRFKLIPEKSSVIILTSIISSSETIRRLVKYVKRDNAKPILILSMSNHRKDKISKLETWESFTEIRSIYTEHTTESQNIIRDTEYFSKKNEELSTNNYDIIQPNYEQTKWANIELVKPTLVSHLSTSKSLNYNHIGIKNDRHFTFYIDKHKLLNSKSLIWDSILSKIEIWKSENSIEEFTIYLKDDFLFDGNSQLINYLKEKYKNVLSYGNLPKIEITDEIISLTDKSNLNAFIIDFGLISGDTINSMLSSFKGLNHLFICIIFNQSRTSKFDYYKRLTSLDNSKYRKISTALQIEFLFELPLNYYNQENCPICNHIEALERYKINDDEEDYMFLFSEDRQKRLKIREKIDVSKENYPFDFYYEFPDKIEQELSSEIIVQMFKLKLYLEDSLINTQSRIELFKYIYDIYKNKREYLKNSNSNLYSLLYYLSYEVHWLQNEPLVFRDFRVMLSEIASYIANYEIKELTNILEESNNYQISALDCAIRYKYSAISLLRSTNKLRFCSEIGNIIQSSYNKNGYSNNLLQNSFFHTFSIYKNKYNKSRNYFNNLIESYNQINRIQELSDDQKLTSNKLYNLLSSKLTEFNIEKLDDIGIIKQLKRNYDTKYRPHTHPQLETNLDNISLIHISQLGLNDIKERNDLSEYFNSLSFPICNISTDWQFVRHYIYTEVLPYYNKFSAKFKNSDTFKSDYILHLFFENLIDDSIGNILDSFSKLVSLLSSNPINYLKVKDGYDKYHSSLFHNLIKKESEFNFFIEQFPLDVLETFELKRINKIFPLFRIEFSKIPLVFYPKSRFMKDLSMIINSIKNRTDEDSRNEFETYGKFSTTTFIIASNNDEKFCYLKISYDKTNSDNHFHNPYESGGLETIKKEVENFGGNLYFEQQNDALGFFHLTFKFLRYE